MAELNVNVSADMVMDTLDRYHPAWMADMLDIVRGNELVGLTVEQQNKLLRGRMESVVSRMMRATYITMRG